MDHRFSHTLAFLALCLFTVALLSSFFLVHTTLICVIWMRESGMGTIQQVCNNTEERAKLKKERKKNKASQWDQTLCYSWRKKSTSLLTCTIKASFAKRKCRSLFLGGQKVERACFDGCREFHEGGFGYLVCHNKGHFCHKHRQCDIGKCSR